MDLCLDLNVICPLVRLPHQTPLSRENLYLLFKYIHESRIGNILLLINIMKSNNAAFDLQIKLLMIGDGGSCYLMLFLCLFILLYTVYLQVWGRHHLFFVIPMITSLQYASKLSEQTSRLKIFKSMERKLNCWYNIFCQEEWLLD